VRERTENVWKHRLPVNTLALHFRAYTWLAFLEPRIHDHSVFSPLIGWMERLIQDHPAEAAVQIRNDFR